jgi:heme exporter protein B
MIRVFFYLLRFELVLAVRSGLSSLLPLQFLLALVMVIPFALGPELSVLARFGPALLWLGILLAMFLSLERLFLADQEDGSLDLLLLGELGAEGVVLAKVFAQWLAVGLPLALASPVLGLMFNLDLPPMITLAVSVCVGSLALAFLSAAGAALTVSLKRGGLVVVLLVLPLAVPVLVFGVAAAQGADDLARFWAAMKLLGALTLTLGVVCTWGAGAALKHVRSG